MVGVWWCELVAGVRWSDVIVSYERKRRVHRLTREPRHCVGLGLPARWRVHARYARSSNCVHALPSRWADHAQYSCFSNCVLHLPSRGEKLRPPPLSLSLSHTHQPFNQEETQRCTNSSTTCTICSTLTDNSSTTPHSSSAHISTTAPSLARMPNPRCCCCCCCCCSFGNTFKCHPRMSLGCAPRYRHAGSCSNACDTTSRATHAGVCLPNDLPAVFAAVVTGNESIFAEN